LNKIEQRFQDAYDELVNEDPEFPAIVELLSQVVIGIYKVDFVYEKCVIEIDGHEFHKSKEQREKDYKRERYLMRQGYTVIRYMGTEVFLNPKECVTEAIDLANEITRRDISDFLNGYDEGFGRGMEMLNNAGR